MKATEFMKSALLLGERAAKEGEVPVGAVVVRGGEIVGKGFNKRETHNSPIGHAEIEAIEQAAVNLGDWRLKGCDIYVTLEPCPMCAGAIINARFDRVFFGAYDSVSGSFGSVADFSVLGYEYSPEVHGGIMEKECAKLLSDFFSEKR